MEKRSFVVDMKRFFSPMKENPGMFIRACSVPFQWAFTGIFIVLMIEFTTSFIEAGDFVKARNWALILMGILVLKYIVTWFIRNWEQEGL